ncbi:3245_t:CDS:2 [Entrophospora sp. SA101]|nr:3245_t:CDS:2 [Entrophospora sp. SA101]
MLYDEEKRAQYDQWSTACTCGFPGGSDANYGGFSGFSEELFSSIFDGVKDNLIQLGSDIEISFMELVKGAKQTTAIETIAFCKACNGLGTKGTKISPGNRCPTCSGIGIEDEQKSNRLDKTKCKYYCQQRIPLYRAIIDGYIVMSMIDGNVELKVPEALQSDQHIVLKTWHKQWQFPR